MLVIISWFFSETQKMLILWRELTEPLNCLPLTHFRAQIIISFLLYSWKPSVPLSWKRLETLYQMALFQIIHLKGRWLLYDQWKKSINLNSNNIIPPSYALIVVWGLKFSYSSTRSNKSKTYSYSIASGCSMVFS